MVQSTWVFTCDMLSVANKMSSKGENLPVNWIRKESRSCPNKFYYFNIKTKQTQWTKPDKDGKMTEKTPSNSEKKANELSQRKIKSKSKNGESMAVMEYANDAHFGLICLH